MKFTDQIASYILENNIDVEHLTIVLPSERAKKYIASSLFDLNGKPMIAPEMITIDRWVRSLSTRSIIDKTRALIQLFYIQQSEKNKKIEHTFDEFLSWGTILLSDFDEIDRYLLDSKEVFRNLADIKELEAWKFDEKEPSQNQKKFMEFWDKLPDYYLRFNQQIEKNNSCYMGFAYREIATNLDLIFQQDHKRQFLFAGFNALSAAEISIMKQLLKMGKGHVLINADNYYLTNPSHEAGQFIRQFLKELDVAKLPFVMDQLQYDSKNIEVVECAQTTGQVKVAATKLLQLSTSEINETLILLADESLITPLLKNLPKKIGKANITLGMPLKASSLRNWVDTLFSIQEGKNRFKTEALYFTDVQRLLKHPFILACSTPEELKKAQELEQSIIKYNRIFIKHENLQLSEKMDELFSLIALNWKGDWQIAMTTIRKISAFIFKHLSNEHQFEKALLEGFDSALIDFQNCVNEGLPSMNLRSFKTLFNQHWSAKSIAYHGNPTDGLQIMGLLETRLLDFKRIICLGMNEGTLPPTNPIQTMIPMDLRRYLHLPTPREKQGLFAHHFYRLLHTAEDVLITYTSANDAISSNEQSRYLLQLELELSRVNPQCHFERKFYTVHMRDEETKTAISIPKTPEIIARLDQLFEKSTSASALKNFAKCPLDFYYKYVLEFGETESVEEDVESNTLGTFIHETLEDLYRPFSKFQPETITYPTQGKSISNKDINLMFEQFPSILTSKFDEHFEDKSFYATGKNLLSFQMANELIKNFLSEQKSLVEQHVLTIESLEELLEEDLEVNVFGELKKVHLKGFVDRIDRVDGKVRIIDYKSGIVKSENVKIMTSKEESIPVEKIMAPKFTFQLLTYCFLYQRKYSALPDEVGIYSFVSIKSGIQKLQVPNDDLEKYVEAYPLILQGILEEIYDPTVPFEHVVKNEFYSYCSYCD